jgi:invasion protein IalB
MLNKASIKQILVAILAGAPAHADPPAAHAPAVRAFHDWRLDCTAGLCAPGTTVAGRDGSEVLRVAVRDGATLTITTRLPLYLPDGLLLAIDGMAERRLPWWTCGAAGCEARLSLDPELEAALRRERIGYATFTLLDGMSVRIGFSLIGYQAAARAAVSPP